MRNVRRYRPLLTAVVFCLAWIPPNALQAATLDIPISAGNDDAEERLSNSNVNRNSSDLELVHEGSREQRVGVRFRNVGIPQGATINSARIQFTVDEVDTGSTNLIVSGQDIGNAPIFASTDGDITNRTQTAATQTWTVPPWDTVGQSGTAQLTPDLSSIVSEITTRADWASGNSMVFMLEAGAGCNSSSCQRTAESFNGVSASAPRLVIDFELPPNADLAVSQSDSPDPISVGSSFAYVITITNNGPLDATGVMLTDTLPASVSLQSITPSQGSCVAGATIDCAIGSLVSGASAQVNIIVSALTAGSVTNTAIATANEVDANPVNNTSVEVTTVTGNIQQLCYLVADNGGGNGGDDLLTQTDTSDFNPTTNETNIGSGTGTNSIEAIAWNSSTQVLFAANANRLGTLSVATGAFSPLAATFGTGTDVNGASQTFSDVDALAYDATTGILYGVHNRGGDDALFQIDMTTGSHVPNAFGLNIDFVSVQSVLGNTITDDIAVDPTTGVMFATVNAGGSTDRLIRINKFTGATQDIAAITVPDIEGLGTDPSGQLWGTSGTQGALYEIDKNTGVGSFARTIDNGTDYEAVDCFAISPSVSTDIAVAKTVDNATPMENDEISYTLTATNNGSGLATSVQLSDVLPPGISFSAAVASQGVFDNTTGNWFVGTLGSSASATLTITATINPGTLGSTITNTVALAFVSQSDPNTANDTASVNIEVAGIQIDKTVTPLSDSISISNPKSIPGAIIVYRIELTNSSNIATDANSIIVVDELPGEVDLVVSDPGGPVTFVDGSPASGLTYFFGGYASTTDDIDFSDDTNLADGISWNYVPSTALPTDPNVTAIRIRPQGSLNGTSGAGDPAAILEYKTQIR